jgi:DNA polymerase III subunit delta'
MKQALLFFRQAVLKNRLAHLYLICGQKGTGKTELVYEVAAMILNKDKEPSELLKRQIREHKLSNMMFIEPDGLSIKKEQILLLQREFSKTALVMGPRLYVIKNIEKMSQSAANSLLKFMEEPTSHQVYGFLLTENKDEVIRTIISRSQIIHTQNKSEFEMMKMLLEQSVDEKMAAILPYLTKNIDEAIDLAENVQIEMILEFITTLSNHWLDSSFSFTLYFAEKGNVLTRDREMFKYFLELLVIYFLDLVHHQANQSIAFEFLKADIQRNSETMPLTVINEIIDMIQETIKKQSYYINLDLAMTYFINTLEKKR